MRATPSQGVSGVMVVNWELPFHTQKAPATVRGGRTLKEWLPSQERVFPSCSVEIPWASQAGSWCRSRAGQPRPPGPPGATWEITHP